MIKRIIGGIIFVSGCGAFVFVMNNVQPGAPAGALGMLLAGWLAAGVLMMFT